MLRHLIGRAAARMLRRRIRRRLRRWGGTTGLAPAARLPLVTLALVAVLLLTRPR
jgi:hypothetical protein